MITDQCLFLSSSSRDSYTSSFTLIPSVYEKEIKAMNMFINMNCIEVIKIMNKKNDNVSFILIMSFSESNLPISITNKVAHDLGREANCGSSAP
jgi:hypothetical protein